MIKNTIRPRQEINIYEPCIPIVCKNHIKEKCEFCFFDKLSEEQIQILRQLVPIDSYGDYK